MVCGVVKTPRLKHSLPEGKGCLLSLRKLTKLKALNTQESLPKDISIKALLQLKRISAIVPSELHREPGDALLPSHNPCQTVLFSDTELPE